MPRKIVFFALFTALLALANVFALRFSGPSSSADMTPLRQEVSVLYWQFRLGNALSLGYVDRSMARQTQKLNGLRSPTEERRQNAIDFSLSFLSVGLLALLARHLANRLSARREEAGGE